MAKRYRPGANRSQTCHFCGIALISMPFQSATRTEEHVLKRSWLDKLGHAGTKMKGYRHIAADDRVELIPTRYSMSIIAQDVCLGCNSGWIKTLDESVSPIVLAKARGIAVPLSEGDRRLLARWVLKTACTHNLTLNRKSGRIAEEVYRKLASDPLYFPTGFVAFIADAPGASRDLRVSVLDHWYGPDDPTALNASQRLKFGVQYDRVMFGCCLINSPETPSFVMSRTAVSPIWNSAATVYLADFSPSLAVLPEGFNFPLNGMLSEVSVALSDDLLDDLTLTYRSVRLLEWDPQLQSFWIMGA